VTNVWEHFLNIIELMLDDAQALLVLSQEKRQVLTRTDKAEVDNLIKITKQEEILVAKLYKFEKQRLAVIQEIVAACELKEEGLAGEFAKSIFQIKKLAGVQYSERIEELGVKLQNCVQAIISLNELNAKLIKQYMEFIEYNVNILSAASCEQTYSTNAGNASELQFKRRSLLNTKI